MSIHYDYATTHANLLVAPNYLQLTHEMKLYGLMIKKWNKVIIALLQRKWNKQTITEVCVYNRERTYKMHIKAQHG